MWIPYTDSVVVVQCNETVRSTAPREWLGKTWDADSRLESLRGLLTSHSTRTLPYIKHLTAMQLRDELIALDPLDVVWHSSVC